MENIKAGVILVFVTGFFLWIAIMAFRKGYIFIGSICSVNTFALLVNIIKFLRVTNG